MQHQKIIYLIGAGRSGTTLLEIILGNGKGIFNCGELNRFPEYDGLPKLREDGDPKYDFWKNIKGKLLRKHDLNHQTQYHKEFEYHGGFFKTFFSGKNSKNREDYYSFLKEQYLTIFDSIQEKIITDSSKYPLRGFHLSQALPYEISYIYIKRDPAAVVRSFGKGDVEQSAKHWILANAYYFFVNFLCSITTRKLRKKYRVVEIKYEDLLEKPEQTLDFIQESIDIDLSDAIQKIKNNESLNVGFLFDGNRIRLNDTIKLKRNRSKPELTSVDKFSRALNFMLYK